MGNERVHRMLQSIHPQLIPFIIPCLENACEKKPELMQVAATILSDPLHHRNISSEITSCLPPDLLRRLICARIPENETYPFLPFELNLFGLKDEYNYKNLKIKDVQKAKMPYVKITRKSSLPTFLNVFDETLRYVESLEEKSPLIYPLLCPLGHLLSETHEL